MNNTLTGAQKVGYFFLGLIMGIPALIITALFNADKPIKKESFKLVVIGFVTQFILGCVTVLGTLGIIIGIVTEALSRL